jgi:Uma2 family endonuclease
MAIADDTNVAEGRRLWTLADVAALPSHLPTGPVCYELLRGNLLMMSPTGVPHAIVHTRITGSLWTQCDQRKLGRTLIEAGLILSRSPDSLLAPDAMFFPADREIRLSPEGWAETMPRLVVEIRSKNDTLRELVEKAQLYVSAGVELVWIADPQRRIVTVYRLGAEPGELNLSDVLADDAMLPGFRLPLVELFAS